MSAGSLATKEDEKSDALTEVRIQEKPVIQGKCKKSSQSGPHFLDMEIKPFGDLDKFKEMFKE